MASKQKFDGAVSALKTATVACGKLSANYTQVISNIQEQAAAIATEMSDPSSAASSDDENKFLELLEKTRKILEKRPNSNTK